MPSFSTILIIKFADSTAELSKNSSNEKLASISAASEIARRIKKGILFLIIPDLEESHNNLKIGNKYCFTLTEIKPLEQIKNRLKKKRVIYGLHQQNGQTK